MGVVAAPRSLRRALRPRRLILPALLLLGAGAALWLTRTVSTDPLLLTVAVPLTPSQNVALALDGRTRRAFVASGEAVDVLDLDTGALLRTVRMRQPGDPPPVSDTPPAAVAIDARTNRAFAVDFNGNRVVTLDARGGRLLNSVTTDLEPGALAVDERSGQLFVGGDQSPGLAVLDARTGEPLLASSPIGDSTFPGGLAVDPGAGHGFAAQQDNGTVVLFDPRTDTPLHSEWGSANAFYSLTVDTRDGRVFACGDGTRNVSTFDARTGALLPAIPVGDNPVAMAVDERTGRAFTSNAGDGTVGVFDTRSLTLLGTVAVGAHPAVAVDVRRGWVVVASDGALSVLDARSGALVRRHALAPAPLAIAVDERAGRVLVVSAATTRRAADPWAWVPRPLRGWLPFVPPPRTRTVAVPPSVGMLDETLLAGHG